MLIVNIAIAQTGNSLLPQEWLGKWKGELKIVTFKGEKTIPMQLTIQPLAAENRWKWFVEYSEGKDKMEKQYELYYKEKGKYVLDEKDSVLIEMSLLDNTIYSSFTTQKVMLFSYYSLRDSKLYFEVISSNMKEPTKSKSDTEKTEVESYPVYAIQKGVLTKIAE